MNKPKIKAKTTRTPRTGDVWTLTETYRHPGKKQVILQRDVYIFKINVKRDIFTCLAAARSYTGRIATLRMTRISLKTWEAQKPVFRRVIK